MEEIYEFVSQVNLSSAGNLIEQFTKTYRALADMPRMGRLRADIAPGLRSVPVGSYILFYREVDDGVQIVRVIHGARDIAALFH